MVSITAGEVGATVTPRRIGSAKVLTDRILSAGALSEFSGARTGYGADMQWIYIALGLIAGWWGAKAFMERKAGRDNEDK